MILLWLDKSLCESESGASSRDGKVNDVSFPVKHACACNFKNRSDGTGVAHNKSKFNIIFVPVILVESHRLSQLINHLYLIRLLSAGNR